MFVGGLAALVLGIVNGTLGVAIAGAVASLAGVLAKLGVGLDFEVTASGWERRGIQYGDALENARDYQLITLSDDETPVADAMAKLEGFRSGGSSKDVNAPHAGEPAPKRQGLVVGGERLRRRTPARPAITGARFTSARASVLDALARGIAVLAPPPRA